MGVWSGCIPCVSKRKKRSSEQVLDAPSPSRNWCFWPFKKNKKQKKCKCDLPSSGSLAEVTITAAHDLSNSTCPKGVFTVKYKCMKSEDEWPLKGHDQIREDHLLRSGSSTSVYYEPLRDPDATFTSVNAFEPEDNTDDDLELEVSPLYRSILRQSKRAGKGHMSTEPTYDEEPTHQDLALYGSKKKRAGQTWDMPLERFRDVMTTFRPSLKESQSHEESISFADLRKDSYPSEESIQPVYISAGSNFDPLQTTKRKKKKKKEKYHENYSVPSEVSQEFTNVCGQLPPTQASAQSLMEIDATRNVAEDTAPMKILIEGKPSVEEIEVFVKLSQDGPLNRLKLSEGKVKLPMISRYLTQLCTEQAALPSDMKPLDQVQTPDAVKRKSLDYAEDTEGSVSRRATRFSATLDGTNRKRTKGKKKSSLVSQEITRDCVQEPIQPIHHSVASVVNTELESHLKMPLDPGKHLDFAEDGRKDDNAVCSEVRHVTRSTATLHGTKEKRKKKPSLVSQDITRYYGQEPTQQIKQSVFAVDKTEVESSHKMPPYPVPKRDVEKGRHLDLAEDGRKDYDVVGRESGGATSATASLHGTKKKRKKKPSLVSQDVTQDYVQEPTQPMKQSVIAVDKSGFESPLKMPLDPAPKLDVEKGKQLDFAEDGRKDYDKMGSESGSATISTASLHGTKKKRKKKPSLVSQDITQDYVQEPTQPMKQSVIVVDKSEFESPLKMPLDPAPKLDVEKGKQLDFAEDGRKDYDKVGSESGSATISTASLHGTKKKRKKKPSLVSQDITQDYVQEPTQPMKQSVIAVDKSEFESPLKMPLDPAPKLDVEKGKQLDFAENGRKDYDKMGSESGSATISTASLHGTKMKRKKKPSLVSQDITQNYVQEPTQPMKQSVIAVDKSEFESSLKMPLDPAPKLDVEKGKQLDFAEDGRKDYDKMESESGSATISTASLHGTKKRKKKPSQVSQDTTQDYVQEPTQPMKQSVIAVDKSEFESSLKMPLDPAPKLDVEKGKQLDFAEDGRKDYDKMGSESGSATSSTASLHGTKKKRKKKPSLVSQDATQDYVQEPTQPMKQSVIAVDKSEFESSLKMPLDPAPKLDVEKGKQLDFAEDGRKDYDKVGSESGSATISTASLHGTKMKRKKKPSQVSQDITQDYVQEPTQPTKQSVIAVDKSEFESPLKMPLDPAPKLDVEKGKQLDFAEDGRKDYDKVGSESGSATISTASLHGTKKKRTKKPSLVSQDITQDYVQEPTQPMKQSVIAVDKSEFESSLKMPLDPAPKLDVEKGKQLDFAEDGRKDYDKVGSESGSATSSTASLHGTKMKRKKKPSQVSQDITQDYVQEPTQPMKQSVIAVDKSEFESSLKMPLDPVKTLEAVKGKQLEFTEDGRKGEDKEGSESKGATNSITSPQGTKIKEQKKPSLNPQDITWDCKQEPTQAIQQSVVVVAKTESSVEMPLDPVHKLDAEKGRQPDLAEAAQEDEDKEGSKSKDATRPIATLHETKIKGEEKPSLVSEQMAQDCVQEPIQPIIQPVEVVAKTEFEASLKKSLDPVKIPDAEEGISLDPTENGVIGDKHEGRAIKEATTSTLPGTGFNKRKKMPSLAKKAFKMVKKVGKIFKKEEQEVKTVGGEKEECTKKDESVQQENDNFLADKDAQSEETVVKEEEKIVQYYTSVIEQGEACKEPEQNDKSTMNEKDVTEKKQVEDDAVPKVREIEDDKMDNSPHPTLTKETEKRTVCEGKQGTQKTGLKSRIVQAFIGSKQANKPKKNNAAIPPNIAAEMEKESREEKKFEDEIIEKEALKLSNIQTVQENAAQSRNQATHSNIVVKEEGLGYLKEGQNGNDPDKKETEEGKKDERKLKGLTGRVIHALVGSKTNEEKLEAKQQKAIIKEVKRMEKEHLKNFKMEQKAMKHEMGNEGAGGHAIVADTNTIIEEHSIDEKTTSSLKLELLIQADTVEERRVKKAELLKKRREKEEREKTKTIPLVRHNSRLEAVVAAYKAKEDEKKEAPAYNPDYLYDKWKAFVAGSSAKQGETAEKKEETKVVEGKDIDDKEGEPKAPQDELPIVDDATFFDVADDLTIHSDWGDDDDFKEQCEDKNPNLTSDKRGEDIGLKSSVAADEDSPWDSSDDEHEVPVKKDSASKMQKMDWFHAFAEDEDSGTVRKPKHEVLNYGQNASKHAMKQVDKLPIADDDTSIDVADILNSTSELGGVDDFKDKCVNKNLILTSDKCRKKSGPKSSIANDKNNPWDSSDDEDEIPVKKDSASKMQNLMDWFHAFAEDEDSGTVRKPKHEVLNYGKNASKHAVKQVDKLPIADDDTSIDVADILNSTSELGGVDDFKDKCVNKNLILTSDKCRKESGPKFSIANNKNNPWDSSDDEEEIPVKKDSASKMQNLMDWFHAFAEDEDTGTVRKPKHKMQTDAKHGPNITKSSPRKLNDVSKAPTKKVTRMEELELEMARIERSGEYDGRVTKSTPTKKLTMDDVYGEIPDANDDLNVTKSSPGQVKRNVPIERSGCYDNDNKSTPAKKLTMDDVYGKLPDAEDDLNVTKSSPGQVKKGSDDVLCNKKFPATSGFIKPISRSGEYDDANKRTTVKKVTFKDGYGRALPRIVPGAMDKNDKPVPHNMAPRKILNEDPKGLPTQGLPTSVNKTYPHPHKPFPLPPPQHRVFSTGEESGRSKGLRSLNMQGILLQNSAGTYNSDSRIRRN